MTQPLDKSTEVEFINHESLSPVGYSAITLIVLKEYNNNNGSHAEYYKINKISFNGNNDINKEKLQLKCGNSIEDLDGIQRHLYCVYDDNELNVKLQLKPEGLIRSLDNIQNDKSIDVFDNPEIDTRTLNNEKDGYIQECKLFGTNITCFPYPDIFETDTETSINSNTEIEGVPSDCLTVNVASTTKCKEGTRGVINDIP